MRLAQPLMVLTVLAAGCGGESASVRGENSGDRRLDQRRSGSYPRGKEEDRRPKRRVSGRTPAGDKRPEKARRRGARFPPAPVLVERAQPETPAQLGRLRERERKKAKARRLPHTRDAGCEKAAFPLAQGRVIWGPPAPRIVSALRRGGKVTIRFAFERFPRSSGCRPFALTASVISGKLDTPGFRLSDRRFRVVTATGTASVRLPPGGPYTARLQAWTLDGRPSRQVKAAVMM